MRLATLKTLALLSSLFLASAAQAQLTATGDDGREVILKENGQWEYSSSDRFALTSDGRRIRLKNDGSWEYLGNQPQAPNKNQFRNSAVSVKLGRVEIEEYKEPPTANRKNPRIRTRTSFYFTATASTLGETITPVINDTRGFTVRDDEGTNYKLLTLSPGQASPIKPGESLDFRLTTKSSPKWGRKNITLLIDKTVFSSEENISLSIPVADIKTVAGAKD